MHSARRTSTRATLAVALLALASAWSSTSRADEVKAPLAACSECTPGSSTSFGPLVVPGNAGLLTVGFLVHMRLQYEAPTDDVTAGDPTLVFRRIRLRLRGRFLDDRVGVSLQFSPLPSAPDLIDAFVDFRFSRAATLRVGQARIPFSRYFDQPTLRLADWANVPVRFGAEPQLGALLAGTLPVGTHYAVGLYTGQAMRPFANGLGLLYAESLPNVSDLRERVPIEPLHPEVVGRIGIGERQVRSVAEARTRRVRYFAALSGGYDFDPVVPRDFSLRAAFDAGFGFGDFEFDLTTLLGTAELGDGDSLAMTGLNFEASFWATDWCELALRFGRTASTRALRRAARAHADAIIAAADEGQRDALTAAYARAGALTREYEIAVGVNQYVHGEDIKLQLDASYLRNEGRVPLDDVRARLLVHVAY